MLIVFTGDGKGKTTAALGTALRALGWRKNISIIQFIKGNKEIGEWKLVSDVASPQIQIFQFFDDNKLSINEKEITESKNKEYKESCEKAWEFARKMIESGTQDLIVLDEVNNALNYDLLDENEVLSFVETRHGVSGPDLIFTGRNASQKLIDLADIVTEMKEIKHPFKKGIKAKQGIDY